MITAFEELGLSVPAAAAGASDAASASSSVIDASSRLRIVSPPTSPLDAAGRITLLRAVARPVLRRVQPPGSPVEGGGHRARQEGPGRFYRPRLPARLVGGRINPSGA